MKLTDALENLQKQFRAAIHENEKLKQELKELKRQKFTSLDGVSQMANGQQIANENLVKFEVDRSA